jgi:hypothetical protein
VTIHWASEWDDCTLGDWSVTGDGKAALWQIDDSQAISKPCSLYYGQLPAQNYDVGPTSGSILSPLITPPAGSVQLRFQRNIDTEPGQAKDLVWLDVVTEGSSTTVWDKSYEGGPGKGWKAVELDLTAIVNGPFQLRFSFDSGDGIDNGGAGVFVDDVRLVSPCP